mmetsp:Transcript_23307/g.56259  ORF Transcript_23307/g.56259 Transcript_23307/m.56259 type:complete len:245 (-) Transcript_23307:907-1641(-)
MGEFCRGHVVFLPRLPGERLRRMARGKEGASRRLPDRGESTGHCREVLGPRGSSHARPPPRHASALDQGWRRARLGKYHASSRPRSGRGREPIRRRRGRGPRRQEEEAEGRRDALPDASEGRAKDQAGSREAQGHVEEIDGDARQVAGRGDETRRAGREDRGEQARGEEARVRQVARRVLSDEHQRIVHEAQGRHPFRHTQILPRRYDTRQVHRQSVRRRQRRRRRRRRWRQGEEKEEEGRRKV